MIDPKKLKLRFMNQGEIVDTMNFLADRKIIDRKKLSQYMVHGLPLSKNATVRKEMEKYLLKALQRVDPKIRKADIS